MKTEAQKRSSQNYALRYPDRVRESSRLAARRYRLNHPEEARAKGRRWYHKNREKRLLSCKKWKDANLEKSRIYRRKARTGRLEIIAKAKDVPCTDCGGRFLPCAMDFDHVRGKKKNNVAGIILSTLEAIQEEIDKCEVVCANCHRVRTWKRANAKR